MLLLLKTYSPISLVFFKKKFELENKKLSLSVAKIIAVEFKYCFLLKAFNILSLPISSFLFYYFLLTYIEFQCLLMLSLSLVLQEGV